MADKAECDPSPVAAFVPPQKLTGDLDACEARDDKGIGGRKARRRPRRPRPPQSSRRFTNRRDALSST